MYKVTQEQLFVETDLKDMCVALLEKGEKMFVEYLSDGKFSNPGEGEVERAKSCPTNNISLERLMAQTDKSIRMTPNANMYTRESKIMFNENKTGQWISKKLMRKNQK